MESKIKNMTDIKIRHFTIDDYDSLIALWEEAGLPYKPQGRDNRDKMLREITGDTAIFLVAQFNGKIIGSVLGTHDGRKGWINRLAVTPEFRHHGIAQLLVEACEKAIYDKGIEIIACLIEPENTVSLDFFKHAGYTRYDGIHYMTKRKHKDV